MSVAMGAMGVSDAGEFDLRRYNGEVTLANPETGGHRTFRIKRLADDSEFAPGQRIVELLDGPNNLESYRGFGFVTDAGEVIVWRKKRGTVFDKYARMLSNPDPYKSRGITYQMAIRCRACNRKLTDPLSIQLGIGPVCRRGR
jgi:hypothetical protein